MKHEFFTLDLRAAGSQRSLCGELWTSDRGEAIVCVDFRDTRSREFFERSPNILKDAVLRQFDLPKRPTVFTQSTLGFYESSEYSGSYAEIARRGYELTNQQSRVFPATADPNAKHNLIEHGTTTFEFGGHQEPLVTEFHVWANSASQGLVLLNFNPDQKWKEVFKNEPFEQMVQAHYDLKRGAAVLVPYQDVSGAGREFVSLQDFTSGKESPRTMSYSDAKFEGLRLVADGIQAPAPENVVLRPPTLSIKHRM